MCEQRNCHNRGKSWDWILDGNKIGRYTGISDSSMAQWILEHLDNLPNRIKSKMFILWARGYDLSHAEELSSEMAEGHELSITTIEKLWLANHRNKPLAFFDLNKIFTTWVYGRVCCPIIYSTLKWHLYENPADRINRQDEAFGAFYQFVHEMLNDDQEKKGQHKADKRLLNEIKNTTDYNTFESIFISKRYTIKDRISTILNITRPTIRVSFKKLQADIDGINNDIIKIFINRILEELKNSNGGLKTTVKFQEILDKADEIGNDVIKNGIKEILDLLVEKYKKLSNLSLEEEGVQKRIEAIRDEEVYTNESLSEEFQELFHDAYIREGEKLFAYWMKVNIVDNDIATQHAICMAFNKTFNNDTYLTRLLQGALNVLLDDIKNIQQQDKIE